MKKEFAGSLLFILMSMPVLLSCNVAPGGVSMIAGNFTPPELLSIDVKDSKSIRLAFSKKVVPDSIQVGELEQTATEDILYRAFDSAILASYEQSESDRLSVLLAENTTAAKKYGLRGTVKDEQNNTLTFVSFFTGYNDSVPSLVISEVQTQYTKPKVEYIELYALSDGNLGGVCLYNAYDGEDARYVFDAIDVKKGEYIVVHFRTIEEGCVNETGADITLSAGAYSSDTARDLWAENSAARLGKTDVILLESRKDGDVLDAVLFAESKYTEWPKPAFADAARRAAESGAWSGGADIAGAVVSDALTSTRTLSRQGVFASGTSNRADWIVTATGGATPGRENSAKAYIAKN